MQRINDVFERVIVINLDRRPDRMATLAQQLDCLGIAFERFPAVDAREAEVEAEWRAYAERPLATLPNGQRPVASYREFYLDYDSEQARLAFLEATTGRKAIATAGAWALLSTMIALAERALEQGWESVLVLEDDALLHKDAPELFYRIMLQLPSDWRVLQIGTMQLHWEESWIEWYSYNLYRCRGSSIASHAYALRKETIPTLLDVCRKRTLPFDLGALHGVKRRFAEHSFTMFPNLAIQDVTESDIGMSRIFDREARKLDNIYRWRLPDYGPAAIKSRGAVRREHAGGDEADQEVAAPPPAENADQTGPRRLARLGRWVRSTAWRGNGPEPDAAADARPAPVPIAAKPRPMRQIKGLPPLRAHGDQRPKSRTIAAVVVGLEGDALVRVLDLLRAGRSERNIEPILITDCEAFELFRDRGLAFEYLPMPEQRRRFAPDLDWEMHRLRRLALIRRKWQPERIIAFGPTAAQMLTLWQGSPFEDDSIHRVAAGAAKSVEMA